MTLRCQRHGNSVCHYSPWPANSLCTDLLWFSSKHAPNPNELNILCNHSTCMYVYSHNSQQAVIWHSLHILLCCVDRADVG
jgi:hypothetical protein